MSGATGELARPYETALRAYLTSGDEVFLQRGYEYGREALIRRGGILEIAMMHHEALMACLRDAGSPESRRRMHEDAKDFFAEALSPFEMAYRQFDDIISAQRRLNELLEEETTRLAHALHDDAQQILASAHIAIANIARKLSPADGTRLRAVRDLLDQAEQHIRRISHELRPLILDDLGLGHALEFLAEGISQRTGLLITLENSLAGRLPRVIETALYRVVQQAVSNVAQHAQAENVTVRLHREPTAIHLLVRDDGIGFSTEHTLHKKGPAGLGLIGIHERVAALKGDFRITSPPQKGTELHVSIPLES